MSTAPEKIYIVEGMTCGHCEQSVSKEVEEARGVISARADHNTGRLVVVGEVVDDQAVRAAVTEAGYRVTS